METNRNLQTSQHHYHCSTTRTRKSNENGTTKDYLVAQFQYNQDTDTYTCPQGETLKPQAVGIRKPPIETAIILKKYRTQNAKHVL
jgi:hypothetical protein